MKLRWLAVASFALAACDPKVQLGDHVTDAAAEGGGSSSDAGDAATGTCDGAGSAPVSVDIFNTSLYGSVAPAFAAREQVLTGTNSPIQRSGASVMCLTDVDFTTDITKITKGNAFPYSYWVKTSVSTPFTNPETQDGSVPPAPTAAPCGAVPPTAVTNAFNCMIQHCDTLPGNTSGTLPGSTDCLSSNCSAEFAQLLLNSSYNACFDCIIDYVASDQPYASSQTACTSAAQAPFAFAGQVPLLILSEYPLSDGDAYILPSTNYRQAVLFSRVHLGCNSVDFYCGSFTSSMIAADLPYTGNYGAGGNPSSEAEGGAYANEQLLQAQRLVEWVQQKSGTSHHAIIVGDWHSSPGAADGGVPQALTPETLNLLSSAPGWTAVSAPQWTPQCTVCPQSENPLNVGSTVGYFTTQPFLYNWPQASTAVLQESLIYTQPDPSVTFGDAGAAAPVSTDFGLSFEVVVPAL